MGNRADELQNLNKAAVSDDSAIGAASGIDDLERDSWEEEGCAPEYLELETETLLARKGEASADGCRAMASDDHARANAVASDRMRLLLENSAQVWTKRADMLDRLETKAAERRRRSLELTPAANDPGKEPRNG